MKILIEYNILKIPNGVCRRKAFLHDIGGTGTVLGWLLGHHNDKNFSLHLKVLYECS